MGAELKHPLYSEKESKMDKAKLKVGIQKYTMIIVLLLVTLFFTWGTQGKILLPQNITNLISQNAYVFVLATGMLLCILTGGNIDLSVGSVVCFVGAVGGVMMEKMHLPVGIAIVLMLLLGAVIGAWQAFWIAYVRIPPFIVTLAGMLLWRGVALLVLDGLTISPMPDEYIALFNNYVPGYGTALAAGILISVGYIASVIWKRIKAKKNGYQQSNLYGDIARCVIITAVVMFVCIKLYSYKGLPTILILLAVIVAAYAYYTSKTVSGRYYYAVGGNENAAKLSGVKTNRVYFIAYVNMAVLSAVAALVCIARFNSAAPTAGTNYEMDAIGACFIGGASAYGGIGTVPGVVIGAIFMGVLNNGMSIMGIDANWQKAVKGLVLLAAVAFDVISKKKQSSK